MGRGACPWWVGGRCKYGRVVQLPIIGQGNATDLAVYIEAKAEALLVKIGRASSFGGQTRQAPTAGPLTTNKRTYRNVVKRHRRACR